jgi:hypothetical protein
MSERASGLDRQIKAIIKPIYSGLSMIASHDQRVGAKALYRKERFNEVARDYLRATLDMMSESTSKDLANKNLAAAVAQFIAYIHELFPLYTRGVLTVLRQSYGRALTDLYKNSLALQKLLAASPSVEDTEVGSLVLPEQRSSPIYTKVENDRIVMDSGHSLHPFLRKEAISTTREYLRKELTELERALKASNIDKKYVEVFSRLQTFVGFSDDAGAIAFGLHVKLMSNLTAKIENELSDVLNVQISSTLTHSAYFASQYKDWIEFVQNAQSYPPRELVDSYIDPALAQVEATLVRHSASVDARIPQTLQLVRAILTGTSDDRKQAIYAAVRSVENLCIAAIAYSYEQAKHLIQDSASKARPVLVGIGAAAIIVIALNVISDFMPVIKNAAELNWILENLPKIEKIGRILSK